MSQQSKTTLQSAINTDIADNTTGNISAADIRNNLINMTDSLLFNTGSSQSITGSLIITGSATISFVSVNQMLTLEATNPLPSITNGSIAFSSSGDFYFGSGSAWNKLTL